MFGGSRNIVIVQPAGAVMKKVAKKKGKGIIKAMLAETNAIAHEGILNNMLRGP